MGNDVWGRNMGNDVWGRNMKKAQERKLNVGEITTLRWMCGVTKLERMRSEIIRGTRKGRNIQDNVGSGTDM